MEDSLFPDAPETPAPIFAYRALKGFIFGSPNDEDENKENIAQSRVSKQQLSPRKPDHAQTLTPQKRKRAAEYVSSPVKSILRPSGVATPRALHLQQGNVGVTFKDIRKSMSPKGKIDRKRQDIGGKSPFRKIVAERSAAAAVLDKRRPETSATEELATTSNRVKPVPVPAAMQKPKDEVRSEKPSQTTATTAETVPFDLEAYMRQTEKEMKRLVQYNQKLREYARKQAEENTKLRLALEECRRENERLKNAEESRQRQAAGADLAAQETFERGARKEVGEKRSSRHTYTAPNPPEAPSTTRTSLLNEKTAVRGVQPPKQETALKPFDPDEQAAGDGASTEQGNQQQQRQSSARLAPDRIAAARERIRMKAAKRKASEISQVDWEQL